MPNDQDLRLALLGGVALSIADTTLTLPYAKLTALLAYLTVQSSETRPLRREALAELLWPELPAEQGRTNLRRALFNLQRALHDLPLFVAGREYVWLAADAPLWFDVTVFSAAAPACPDAVAQTASHACLPRLEQALELYRGEFMAEFALPDSPQFEDWLRVQRQSLHNHALALLEHLAACREQAGAYDQALPHALRHLELDAWSETAYRRAMRLCALNGQRGTALALFDTCCRVLHQELGLLPELETRSLADAIRRGELSANAAGKAVATPVAALPGEKRQVTVLYCRLTLPGSADLEDALERLRAPLENCQAIIQRYCGYRVPDHAGGILAYFGYPQALEHAARWAVQTALAMVGTTGPHFDIRLGVHSGAILTGGELSLPDVVGTTSGQAIEMARLAGNGEVVVSTNTRRLVAAYFEHEPLARPDDPVPSAYKIWRESGVRSYAQFGLTPLIGREQPLAQLMASWQQARQGSLQKLLIRGEPGIGKSRLLHALRSELAATPCLALELRCFQEYQHMPFYPLLAGLESLLGLVAGESGEARFAKLATYIQTQLPQAAAQHVPLLAEWLSLPLAAGYRPSTLAPAQQKEKIFAILFDLLLALAARQPLLLIIEDLHWLDYSTQEWVNRLIAWQPPAAMLALFTARPQYRPSWPADALGVCELAPLSATAVTAMVQALAEHLPAASRNWIVARADGVPLFVEEMVRLAPSRSATAIPDTLQDLLAARLDATGAAKPVAQLAATIGREFHLALLHSLSAMTPADLQTALHALQSAGLIETGNGAAFQFKHALLCDAAYQSQPKAQRQATHRRIAAILQDQFAELAETRPEVLAQHWALGEVTLPALEYWLKAGQRAERHSANREALDHYHAALCLIETLPPGPERNRWEFIVQVRLGIVLFAVEGLGSAHAALAFRRALPLCQDLDHGIEAFRALWGLWVATLDRSFAEADRLAHKLLSLTGAPAEAFLRVQARYVIGNNAFWLGNLAESRRHLEAALSLYLPAYHGALTAQFGENSAVTSGIILSWTLWLQGFPDQARRRSTEAVNMARALDHPYSYCFALSCAAILRRWLGEAPIVTALAEETLQLAQQYEFSLWQAVAVMSRGWSTAMQGEPAGLEQLDAAIHAMRAAMGSAAVIFLVPQIEARLRFGQYEPALAAVEQALTEAGSKSDCHFVAELHRLKGECLRKLVPYDTGAAESCFQQALTISRRQTAKALELRAAMSLAELWSMQDRQTEAHDLVAAVYAWFDEGFDTPDLQKAERLLRQECEMVYVRWYRSVVRRKRTAPNNGRRKHEPQT